MTEWQILVSYPAGDLNSEQAAQLAAAADGPITIDGNLHRITLAATVTAKTLTAAIKKGVERTDQLAAAARVEPKAVAITAEPWSEIESRIPLAALGVVAMAEVADILSVSRQRAHEIAKQAGFPKPIDKLTSGAVYNKAEVETYAATRSAKRGRPRKVA